MNRRNSTQFGRPVRFMAVVGLCRSLAAVAAAVGMLSTAGCGPNHGQLVEFLRAHDTAASTGHYTVYPPDVLIIHAPGAEEIDGTHQTVRPDGKIVLRLLGEVQVAGLTTQEISEKIKAQLSRYYVDPEVVLEVSRYRSQFYYVFGQVKSPGAKMFTGRDTLLKALADAQPTFLAWRSQIKVVRPSSVPGEPKTITIDLDDMVRHGEVQNNVLLQEGDIVQVPPTPLAWIGLRVRELLYPIEPVLRTYNGPASTLDSTRQYKAGVDADPN